MVIFVLLLSVPFDILVLLVSRSSAVGLVLLVSYSLVSCLLRFFVAYHSIQVNDYSFLLLFSLFLVLGISSYFSLYFGHPLNFCHPLKSVVWGENSVSLSLFILGAVFLCGIILGVLFLVSLVCTLGVVLIFSLVVGVDDVCVLFSCCFSSFSVAVSNI